MPRGSVATKKRQSTDEGSPLLKKKQKPDDEDGIPHSPMSQHPQMQGHGVLKPQPIPKPQQPRTATAQKRQSAPSRPPAPNEQPPIDPSLFSMYPEPGTDGAYEDSSYPYPSTDQSQPFNPQASQAYQLPSLEQIANEVLVDMNGNEVPDQSLHDQQSHLLEQVQAFNAAHTASTENEQSKPDESVDSAVSLPTTEMLEQNAAEPALLHDVKQNDAKVNGSFSTVQVEQNKMPAAHSSIEAGGMAADETSNPPPARTETSPARPKSSANDLPLWQPPAPLSHSPEIVKRQPALTNGAGHGKSSSPTESTPHKRKRDSSSVTPGAKMKKMKVEVADGTNEPFVPDKQSMELAKMLQQEDLGLRRRSK